MLPKLNSELLLNSFLCPPAQNKTLKLIRKLKNKQITIEFFYQYKEEHQYYFLAKINDTCFRSNIYAHFNVALASAEKFLNWIGIKNELEDKTVDRHI